MGYDPAREVPGKGANETKPEGLLFIRGSGFHDSSQGKPRLLITLIFGLRYGGLSEIPAVTFASLKCCSIFRTASGPPNGMLVCYFRNQ